MEDYFLRGYQPSVVLVEISANKFDVYMRRRPDVDQGIGSQMWVFIPLRDVYKEDLKDWWYGVRFYNTSRPHFDLNIWLDEDCEVEDVGGELQTKECEFDYENLKATMYELEKQENSEYLKNTDEFVSIPIYICEHNDIIKINNAE